MTDYNVKLHLTPADILKAAVQECQPISIAIERVFEAQGLDATAVLVAYDTIHVYSFVLPHVAKLHVPAPMSTFNRAYWRGTINTIDTPIYAELTDAEHYPNI